MEGFLADHSPQLGMAGIPKLAAFATSDGSKEGAWWYGVAFDRHRLTGTGQPVFAVVGGRDAIVYQINTLDSHVQAQSHGRGQLQPPSAPSRPLSVEILHWFESSNVSEDLYCCEWTQSTKTGTPLLCAGGKSGLIEVFNATSGRLQRELSGHTGAIHALAVSPLAPGILASGSADHSVRLWTLDPKHSRQRCVAIFAGGAHQEAVLTLAFHGSGRWLLSGAADHVVNLWLVPDLEDFSKDADDPFVIHFPHFSTSQIHTNYVDSLCFHHDLIVSKCANDDKVVLWKITGFSSADRPPEYHACPTKHERAPTISAFGPGYERLMQLRHSKLRPYFMRFGFVNTHDDRAMLALGMADGEVSFWDLSRLDEHESTATSRRGASIADPFAGVEPLAVISTPHRSFHISQVAYSADGKWMAAVGTRPAGVAIFAIS